MKYLTNQFIIVIFGLNFSWIECQETNDSIQYNLDTGYGFYKRKTHTVKYDTMAGLGGSPLGNYLAYRLGIFTSSLEKPINERFRGIYEDLGIPPYYMIHYYHPDSESAIGYVIVDENIITACNDVYICIPGTTPLCTTDGYIYCVVRMKETIGCKNSSTTLPCLATSLTAPCLNTTDKYCHNMELITASLEIPCVNTVKVFGGFNRNLISAQIDSPMNPAYSEERLVHGLWALRHRIKKYCVAIIAEPFDLSNPKYTEYRWSNPKVIEKYIQRSIKLLKGGLVFLTSLASDAKKQKLKIKESKLVLPKSTGQLGVM